jgi:hypothetical protein
VAATVTGGSLVVAPQRLTATGVSGVINVQTTIPAKN